jgi:glycyl-tRNA synthetase
VREHEESELAHYAKRCVDVEYEFPFGWQELEGIADRGDFDLSQHEKFSGKRLGMFDEATKSNFVPHVVETSAGVDRTLLTVLADAYDEEEVKGDTRVVLRLAPAVAPVQVGIFPLVKKPELKERARNILADLRRSYLCFYDESGAIGRRYRRQDEVGTPFCVTVDFETVEQQTVTIRHRDSMEQERVSEDGLAARIAALIGD